MKVVNYTNPLWGMRICISVESNPAESMRLPSAFTHLAQSQYRMQGKLKSKRGTWDVEFDYKRKEWTLIGIGWQNFCVEHRSGDVLVFEYHGNMVFIVWAFGSQASEKFVTGLPYNFIVPLPVTPLSLRQEMVIPPALSDFIDTEKNQWARIQTRMGRWRVELVVKDNIMSFRGPCYADFYFVNYVPCKDMLMMTYHDRLKFIITLFNEEGIEDVETVNGKYLTKKEDLITNGSMLRCICMELLTFTAQVSEYNVLEDTVTIPQLYIPTKVWKSNNLKDKKKVVLRMNNGLRRKWYVSLKFLRYRLNVKKNNRMAFTKGFEVFCRMNGIGNGDLSEFLMVELSYEGRRDTVLFEVTKLV